MSQGVRLVVLVIALVCAVTIVSGSGPVAGTDSPATSIQASAIPVGFVANTGMQDPSVLYFARPAGSVIFCTRDEVVIVKQPLSDSGEAGAEGAVIHLSVEGASPQSVDAIDPLPGKVNMILGSDSSRWQSNLPVYGAVRYTNILPGIDHIYRANGAVLKREFLISPHVDPSSLILHYGGVTGVRIDSDGALLLSTTSGVLREAPPVCYQDSATGRIPVDCDYILLGENAVGFAFGPYDPALTIVVDPQLEYSTFLGGTSDDCSYAIAVDPDGYAYIAGSTVSTDFPVKNAFDWTKKGWTDIFVTKFDFATSKLVYSTYIGGRLDEVAYAITLNDVPTDYCAYITGYTESDDYPILNPIDPDWVVYNPDIIVTALGADGTALIFSTVYGGSRSDYGRAIQIDPDNPSCVWVAGYTFSCDFVPDSPPFVPFQEHVNLKEICPDDTWCCVMGADGFLAEFKYDDTVPETTLEYATYISGYDDDRAYGLVFNQDSNPVIVGTTSSPNFPMFLPYQGNLQGYSDAFILMLDRAASNPFSEALFSTYFGGSGDEVAKAVTILNGQIAIAGTTDSPDLPLESPYQGALAGEKDAFLAIFNVPHTDLDYSTYYGGSYSEHVNTMAASDDLGHIYIGGYTRSRNFPLNGSIKKEMLGFQDAFITGFAFDPTAMPLVPVPCFSTYLGGNLGDDEVTGIALDTGGNFYATGYTGAKDFPLVAGKKACQGSLKGFQDAFLVKFNLTSPPVPIPLIANFTADPLTGQVPLTVQFTDTSHGGPTSWNWSFGDGEWFNTTNPALADADHTYQYAGNYTVSLTVANGYSSNNTSKVEYINPYDDRTSSALLFFVPSHFTVPLGMNRKVAMFLNRTPTGMGGYNFTLNTSVQHVTTYCSAQRPSWSMGSAYSGTLPASSITLIGIDYKKIVGIGEKNVSLGTITFTGSTTGTTNTTLSAVGRFEDQFGKPMNLTVENANITVGMLFPVPDFKNIPRDLDGDWLFEDVNGDNKFSFADLIAFFENLEWIADNEPNELFDFDGNHRINFGDIIALFHLI